MTILHSGMTEPTAQPYRGRFAPSPTGPLHFGSLIAATGSFLQARAYRGEWLLRIDDIDPPREIPGASEDIRATLERFGFEWDGPIVYQSQRNEIYQETLAGLRANGCIYPCACTRKTIAETQALVGTDRPHVYPGTCRKGLGKGRSPRLLRLDTRDSRIRFHDLVQGKCYYDMENDIGDFVVLRADGLFAYQLATGVDDALQGITQVVRGSDLLDSTPCQILIQQQLGLVSPEYAHLPVILNPFGQKLSKQNLAPALDHRQSSHLLWQALKALGQRPPAELGQDSPANLWQWAIEHWQAENIPRQKSLNLSEIALLQD